MALALHFGKGNSKASDENPPPEEEVPRERCDTLQAEHREIVVGQLGMDGCPGGAEEIQIETDRESEEDSLDEDAGQDRVPAAATEFLANMQATCPEMIRAIHVWQVLRRLALPLRAADGDFYPLSHATTRPYTFWSHSWHGALVAQWYPLPCFLVMGSLIK